VDARDEQALLSLFAPDAVWTADGGGRTAASPRRSPAPSASCGSCSDSSARLPRETTDIEIIEVNGETGLRFRTNGQVIADLSILSDGQRIHAVYGVVNPDKLVPLER
jgi:RNA polymerase sigma-70 factor (ECF subfamily)